MASNFKLSNAAANAAIGDGSNNGVLVLLAGGYLNFYDGTQPANPDVAVSTQNSYGSVALASPAGTTSSGVLTFATTGNATIPGGLPGNATPTWFRLLTSGNAAVADGSCGNTGNGTYDGNVGGSAWVSGGIINGSALGSITIAAH